MQNYCRKIYDIVSQVTGRQTDFLLEIKLFEAGNTPRWSGNIKQKALDIYPNDGKLSYTACKDEV